MPKISVIMPFYNCEKFLDASISSILWQTFSDFEFIIINDASTDNSDTIVQKYITDTRIIYIKNTNNKWIVQNLNQAVSFSHGEFIARMDGDDISNITRLEKQYNFLASHKEISIVGTFLQIINTNWIFQYNMIKPVKHDEIKRKWLKFLTLAHQTSMFHRTLYDSIWPYREEYLYCEDLDFICRAIFNWYLWANIPEFLYSYRHHSNSTRQYAKIIARRVYKLKKEVIKRFHIRCSYGDYWHIYGQFLLNYVLPWKYFAYLW